jgi:hypothetical protein
MHLITPELVVRTIAPHLKQRRSRCRTGVARAAIDPFLFRRAEGGAALDPPAPET